MADLYTGLAETLRNTTIFAGLADDGLRKFVNQCATITARKGEIIIREGAPSAEILIILEGRVKITLDQQSDPLEICELGPGDCLGEVSVIGVTHASASAVAIQDTSLLVLSRSVLMKVFESDKEFFSLLLINIARELARRLHRTDEILRTYVRSRKSSS